MSARKKLTIAVSVILFSAFLYVVSYLAVANSEAVEVARKFAVANEYFDQGSTPRVGKAGFMIKVSGGSGNASFNMIGSDKGKKRVVYFEMEKKANVWRVASTSTETKGSP